MEEIKTLHRKDFPETLKNASGSPGKLYLRGNLPENKDQKYLCVIGSRLATQYGIDCVNKIIKGLRGYPISIVSGLAIGIDGIAHRAALECGLHCVGFPGSTLQWDSIYPASNISIAKQIVESGGALLSKWKAGYDTGKWAFPARNKLMADISHAVLIIEAGKGSGALMTAEYAVEDGRDVFAIPGSIFSGNSYGPAMLISSGAKVITNAEDVLDGLGLKRSDPSRISLQKIPGLDEQSSKVLETISAGRMSFDYVVEKLGISPKILNEKISFLEVEGLVRIEGEYISPIR